jgi:hypothetical protein
MKLIPKPHMLKSIRARNWHLTGAISELVDNSLDHGKATKVQVFIDNARGVVVNDNGTGMADINDAFWYGSGTDHETLGQIGKYGVGTKQATIWMGDLVKVSTVREGRAHVMAVDWSKMEQMGEWPDAYTGPGRAASSSVGTKVVVRKLARHYQLKTSQKLARDLGHCFAPGIRAGAEIVVAHVLRDGKHQVLKVEPFYPADMSDEIEIGGSVSVGRGQSWGWRGRAGLSASLIGDFNAVHIAFRHRFIESTREPFGGESAPTLYCEVTLDDNVPWKEALSENKDKIVRYREGLMESIQAQIEELISRSAQQASYLALKGLTAPIESHLTRALRAAGLLHVDPDEEPEEGPGRGEGEGPVASGSKLYTPTDTGDPGREANKPTGVMIDWRTPEQLAGKVWDWQINGKALVILLDKDEFSQTIGWPPSLRDRHVLQLIASYLAHALEMEYWNNTPRLVGIVTPRLQLQIEQWAGAEKIAPYLNRAVLTSYREAS